MSLGSGSSVGTLLSIKQGAQVGAVGSVGGSGSCCLHVVKAGSTSSDPLQSLRFRTA